MEMHRVLAGRQVVERQLYFHTNSVGANGCGSDIVALRVLQRDCPALHRFLLSESGGDADGKRSRDGKRANHQWFVFHDVRVLSRKRRFCSISVIGLNDFDARTMATRTGKFAVAGKQRRIECFRQRNIKRIVGGQVVA